MGIYLRAVATQNGRILKTVNTTKTILSQQIDVGIFRFVRIDRLLEAEAGLSYNEPPQMAVLEAVEKAVLNLIIEGIVDGNWRLKNPEDINAPVILRYLEEKQDATGIPIDPASQDMPLDQEKWKQTLKTDDRNLGIGMSIGGAWYRGDYPDVQVKPAVEGFVRAGLNRYFAVTAGVGQTRIAAQNRFNTTVTSTTLKGIVNLSPRTRLSAYLGVGGSLYKHRSRNQTGSLLANSGWQLGLTAEEES